MVRIAEHNIYVLRECTLALIAGIFPIARIGAITSLACGAVLDLEFCRYAGKGQGELSLLRRLWDVLRPSDVLLADNLLSNWTGTRRAAMACRTNLGLASSVPAPPHKVRPERRSARLVRAV